MDHMKIMFKTHFTEKAGRNAFLTPVFTAVSWPRDTDARMRGVRDGRCPQEGRRTECKISHCSLPMCSEACDGAAAASTVPSRVNMSV